MSSDFAQAIAHAEGFGQPQAIPTLAHNPGDLVCPWLHGPKLGAEGIHIFEDDATGWAALEHQLALIRAGKSGVYHLNMTISEMASQWTSTQQLEWASNVVDWLIAHGRSQTTRQTRLKDVL